jgi:perosamine synthetase
MSEMIRHSLPTLGQEEAEAVSTVIASGNIAQGREVEAFEQEVAEFVGKKHGVAVSSGTAALHLSLIALSQGRSQHVAMPSYACAALVTATGLANHQSTLVDITDQFNIDIKKMPENADITVVPHLFGAKSDLPDTTAVIEDIAQSIGGTTGAESPIAVASFYATKVMTTGEGGMVLTNDSSIAEQIRDLRDYDNRDELVQRFTYKLTDMQAAMGRVQLKRLPSFVERRRAIAARYTEAFRSIESLKLPDPTDHIFSATLC